MRGRWWGGQSCPQPAFRPAGPAGKRVRGLKARPTTNARVRGEQGCGLAATLGSGFTVPGGQWLTLCRVRAVTGAAE